MENFVFGVGSEGVVLRVVGTCVENAFWSAFHECNVCTVFEVMIDDCHAFDSRVEVVFLDVFITNSIFIRLDVFQGSNSSRLVKAGLCSKDLQCDLHQFPLKEGKYLSRFSRSIPFVCFLGNDSAITQGGTTKKIIDISLLLRHIQHDKFRKR